MKTIKIFALFSLAIFLFSCSDEDTPKDLNINMQLSYGGEPLVLFDDLSYPDGTAIQVSNFSFYVSKLMANKGSETTLLTDIDFWDFDDSNLTVESAEAGKTFNYKDVDLSDIDGLSFNIGLTPDQNATVPSDYSSDNPLSMSGEYWLNWESYIFIKIEGFYDSDNDGVPDSGFNLHLGSDAVMQQIEISNLNASDNTVNLAIDLLSVFEQNNELYDLLATPRIHSLAQINEAMFLANNLRLSLGSK
jgi:hypothetical protein